MMGLITISVAALLGTVVVAPTDARDQWLWFAEYDVVSPRPKHLGKDALFIFKHRFVPAAKHTPVTSVVRFDVASSFDVYKQDDAYFADALPLFAPSTRRTSISGGQYDCEAIRRPTGYAVTCRSNYSGDVLRSFYEPNVGVRWFEYFCGHPQVVCRYNLVKGKALFRGEFIDAVERIGDVRTHKPFRPKLRQ